MGKHSRRPDAVKNIYLLLLLLLLLLLPLVVAQQRSPSFDSVTGKRLGEMSWVFIRGRVSVRWAELTLSLATSPLSFSSSSSLVCVWGGVVWGVGYTN